MTEEAQTPDGVALRWLCTHQRRILAMNKNLTLVVLMH